MAGLCHKLVALFKTKPQEAGLQDLGKGAFALLGNEPWLLQLLSYNDFHNTWNKSF